MKSMRFIYEDNLIQISYSDTKKALITTPSSTTISTAFFSNIVIQDFQENSDDEVDESSSEEYLRDLDIEYHERALLAHSKYYKAEYKKMKAKLALLEASPSSSQNPKTFQPKNKGLVAETFDWVEEEVSDDEEVTQVKVLIALADDELTVGKSHAHNDEWVNITIRKVNTLLSMDKDADWQNYLKYINIDLKFVEEERLNLLSKYNKMVFELNKCRYELLILKQAKLDAVTFQIQNTELTKLNHALQEQLKEEKKINEKWLTSSKKRLNHDSKLPNFNTRRILIPESQAVNESLESTETLNTPESSKDSEAESLTLLHPLKNLQGSSPSSEIQQTESSKSADSSKMSQDSKSRVQNVGSSKSLRPKPIQKPQLKCKLCHYTNHLTDDCYRILYYMICKRKDHRTSDHEMYTTSLKRSGNYKAQPYQYASSFKQILNAKAKPFPPCTHYGFNDHRSSDCRNYPECGICESYDHFTSGHNRVIHIKGGMLAESFQSSESLISVKCNTCGSTIHSTTDHNDFDHFKRETHQGAHLVNGQWMLKEYDWCQELFAQIFRATRMEPSSLPNTLVDEILIDDSSRYPPDEFLQEDDPSRQYQVDFDVSYYIIPHGLSLTELTQENHVPEVIVPNEPNIPHTEDTEGNNTKVSGSITESLVPDVTQSHISNQASASSHLVPQDRWSKDQQIELVNIIGDPGKGMLTRTMAAKLTASLASECLFADFLSKIEPKKGSKWVFRNKKDEHGITKKQEPRLVAQGYSQDIPCLCYIYELQSLPNGCQKCLPKCPVCKISVKSKGITSNNCKKNPQSAKKQQLVAMSSAEVEYVVVVGYCASILWMKSQLSDYGINYKMVPIFCNHTSAIAISNNPVLHSRTKHIDIRYHFIMGYILKGDIELHYIPTEYRLAEIFTKPLDEPTFTRLKVELGMLDID
ncbi:hypothetical protein Tco_1556736 [Tanacetum coccineum]